MKKQCPYCNEYFTSQGLPGHIKLVHLSTENQESSHIDSADKIINSKVEHTDQHDKDENKNHSLRDVTIAGAVIFVFIKYGKEIGYKLLKFYSATR